MNRTTKIMALLICITLLLSVAGCAGTTQPSTSASITGANQSSASNTSATSTSGEKIKLTIMDFSDAVKTYRDQANANYMKDNPNITVEYTVVTKVQLTNTILTAVKSGQAPDIFPLPSGVTSLQAVNEGWYLPLSDYTDASEWDRYLDGMFAEGKCKVNGKIYMIPENPYGPSSCVFYNKKIFKEAGLNPEVTPKTYSEFREYAKKITAAGKGKYYGVVEAAKQMDRMDAIVVDWGNLNGSSHRRSGYPINLRTGTPNWSNDEAVEKVFELWQNLYEDGSIHPNTGSYNNPDARATFAQGQAGMIVNGWWNVGTWTVSNPELEFGLFAPPVPDGETYTGSIPLTTAGAWSGVYAQTKHPQEAVDYFLKVIAGEEFQSAAVAAGVHISFLKGINEEKNVLPVAKLYYELNNTLGKYVPETEIANMETNVAISKYQEVHPTAYEIFAGVITGQVKDYRTALNQYTTAAEAAWDQAITAANKEGHNLSVADFAFPDWDPTKDFTEEDYAKLKK